MSRVVSSLSAPPIFRSIPRNTTVNETDYVVLTCTVSRGSTIKWLKDGKDLVTGDGVFVLTGGHLTFIHVSYTNRGWYACVAKNEGGEKTARAYLNVKKPLAKGKQISGPCLSM